MTTQEMLDATNREISDLELRIEVAVEMHDKVLAQLARDRLEEAKARRSMYARQLPGGDDEK